MFVRLACYVYIGSLFSANAIAQDVVEPRVAPAPFRAMRMLPASSRGPTLSKLVRVKVDAAGENSKLILMLPSYRIEKGEGFVTEVRNEQRTRVVMIDGRPQEQVYTVAVPVRKRVPDAEIRKPAGMKPKTIDVDNVSFFQLNGEPMSVEEAAKRLAKLSPVFLLDGFRGTVNAIPEIQQQALKEDCVIITCAERIRESGASVVAPRRPIQAFPVPKPDAPARDEPAIQQ